MDVLFDLRWIIRIYLLCCLRNEINRFIKRNYRGLVVTTSKKKKKKEKGNIPCHYNSRIRCYMEVVSAL